MGRKHTIKGRSKAGPPFVQLPWFMLDSDAWRALTPQQVAAYIELSRLYNGANNGRLALSVRDAAERCKINKDTANKALATLETLGFIECATPGGFSRKVRHATEWRLTLWRCDRTGALPSKAFMKWRPAANPDLGERNSRSHLRPRRSLETGHSTPEQIKNGAECPKSGDRERKMEPFTVPNEGTHIHLTMVGASRTSGLAGRSDGLSDGAERSPAPAPVGTVTRLECPPEKIGPARRAQIALERADLAVSSDTLHRAVANG